MLCIKPPACHPEPRFVILNEVKDLVCGGILHFVQDDNVLFWGTQRVLRFNLERDDFRLITPPTVITRFMRVIHATRGGLAVVWGGLPG